MSQSIGDYALLADCNSAALVGRGGSIDWLCLPRYDSPSVFARILDPGAGHWSIRPHGRWQPRRRYLPGSLVLETTFQTSEGRVRVIDALAFERGQRGHALGLSAPHEVLRLVEGLSGRVELELELVPRPEYGIGRPLLRLADGGAVTWGGPDRFAVSAAVTLSVDDDALKGTFAVEAGDRVGFALRWAPVEAPAPSATPAGDVAAAVEDAVEAWRSWEAHHDIYEGPHRELVRLSSRVLKGLTYRPTGAVVAAPTTSLPETIGGERNWDYRYSWIRDASLTLDALWIGTCPDEVDDFVSWMEGAAGGHVHQDRPLQIVYGVGGERDLAERELPHLRGYRDSRPVRVGNGAWNQTQLDVYGEFLDAYCRYVDRLREPDEQLAHFLADLADTAAARWQERGSGIWEARAGPQHYLSGKLYCWVALDCAIRLAPRIGAADHVERWSGERERIREAILTRCWSASKHAFTQAFDSEDLDAAALLVPLVGFLPATDERVLSTLDAIERELVEEGLVLRYRSDDGLSGGEGTFVICSFWLVSALAGAGRGERAEQLFEKVAGFANDLGLLAEEIDPRTGELLGNFPQAFSHVGLITAAYDLDRASA
jgi:GH15 family glucan-1,4-alpha-glucosidase